MKEVVYMQINDILNKEEQYWLSKFSGDILKTNLPGDYMRFAKRMYEKSVVDISLDSSLSSSVIKMCKDVDSLLLTFVMSVVNITLNKYTGNRDIILGTSIHKANDKFKVLNSILALRNTVEPNLSFKQFLLRVKETIAEAYSHQKYSFAKLIAKLNLHLSDDPSPLFDVTVLLENINDISDLESLQNNISIIFNKQDGIIRGRIEYNSLLYARSTINQLGEYLKKVIKTVLNNPDIELSQIELCAEKEKIIYDFNSTVVKKSYITSICQLFEEQVRRVPDNIAVSFANKRLTYEHLNKSANKLAKYLEKKQIGPGSIVGLLVNRSIELIVGILAVLKIGAAYCPIDPEYPLERKQYILEDIACPILLSTSDIYKIDHYSGEIIHLDDDSIYTGDGANCDNQVKPEHLAYIIYTSGSTGTPKGVMVTRNGLTNYLTWASNMYVEAKQVTMPLYTSISFDLTVTSIYVPLITGNTILIYGHNDDELQICKIISQNKVDLIKLTPAHLQLITEIEIDGSRIKRFIVGGEELKTELAREIYNKFNKNVEIFNEYGPTEATVGCMIYKFDEVKDTRMTVPIGIPIDNTQIYILDDNLKPVAPGIIGEIYISGDSIAKGYWNKQDLTEERFLTNPFLANQKLYKTGDLGKIANDVIEFYGRIDNQVKVRGYRIELGEIENVLLQYKSIKDAIVLVHRSSDDSKYILAFFIAEEQVLVSDIKSYLANKLAYYMIPSIIVQVESFPLTPNGKIDKKILITHYARSWSTKYVAPANDLEKKLVKIWSEVLGGDKIGVNDNLFELGGHSLKATLIVSKIFEELNVKILLTVLFNNPTIRELAVYIESITEDQFSKIRPAEVSEYYPVSSAQRRIYVLQQYEGIGLAYNTPGIWIIEGNLDISKFEDAIMSLFARHDAFKTSFVTIDGEVYQRINHDFKMEIEYFELTDSQKIEHKIREFIKPFDLKVPPLTRIGLGKMQNGYLFLMDVHHIISDGVSAEIIFKEFVEFYQGNELAPLEIQYKDFVAWQNELLESDTIKEQEEFWLDVFADEIPSLNLLTDFPRPSIMTFEGDNISFDINLNLVKKIEELGVKTETTEFMFLLSVYYILLAKYSGQEDMVVGLPIAGRTHPDLYNVVGIFANTLPLRNRPAMEKMFFEFLIEVKDSLLQALEFQDYQLEMLVDKLNIERDMSRHPIFDTVFVLQSTDLLDVKLNDLKFTNYNFDFKISKFDFRFALDISDGRISCELEYNTRLFSRATIEALVKHYQNILWEVVKNPEVKLEEIEMLSDSEKQIDIIEFNNTREKYDLDKNICQIFEEQVARTPDRVALVYQADYISKQMTYQELNMRANQLARYLRERGASRENIVGLMVPNSFETIIAILGILKTGGAYLPLDPDHPTDRIRYIIEDSGVDLVLTNKQLTDKIENDIEKVNLEDSKLYTGDISNLPIVTSRNNLVYIIYTSGSTGNPKGVMVTHKGLLNYVIWAQETYVSKENESNFPLYSSIAVDMTVTSIYVPLISGNQVIIYGKESKEMVITKVINDSKVQIIKLTPAHLQIIRNMDISKTSIKKFIIGGEELIRSLAVGINQQFSGQVEIFNEYGPTETIVGCMIHKFNPDEDMGITVPIGVPISNTQIYLLDKSLKPVVRGVVGEIYISGVGVARGYLNREKLTEERFLTNPWLSGEVMYKTGDLAKRLDNGKLQFLGRSDNQIKIQGFRIEPEEIESHLRQHKLIKDVVIVDRLDEKNERQLCAYIVYDGPNLEIEMVNYLRTRVPEYMIPSFFIRLDKIPLNSSGKVDKKALPFMVETLAVDCPDSEITERLLKIWQEVLGKKEIGMNDNFFAIGGHSIKVTQMAAKIFKEMNVELSLMEVFAKSTIYELSQVIKEKIQTTKKADESILTVQPIDTKEYYPMSSAQKRLYFLNKLENSGISYNMPFALRIESELNIDKFEQAIQGLVDRHESLRTYFEVYDGEPVQKICNSIDFTVDYLDTKNMNTKKLINKYIRSFDLSKAPLFRVGLGDMGDHYLFLIDIHHIISDGVSIDILLEDFLKLYDGEELPELEIQYKDFAAWQNHLLKSEKMKEIETYWLNIFSGEIPVLDISTDYPRTSNMTFEGDTVYFQIDQVLSEKIRKLADEQKVTLFMLLLATYYILLSKYTGQDDIVVGSVINGRPYNELQNIVGMFVNTLALRNAPVGEKKFTEFLADLKDNCLQAFDNQMYQFDMLIERLNIKREMGRNPLVNTGFTIEIASSIDSCDSSLQLQAIDVDFKISKGDISLAGIDTEHGIDMWINYSIQLFKKQTIEKMAKHYVNILQEIVEDVEKEIVEITMLSPEELQQLLYKYDEHKVETVHQLFEKQVLKTFNAIAIIFKGEKITFKELDARANKLARFIRKRGVTPNQIIGVMIQRSINLVITILGVLKAGAAYLLIDPNTSQERMKYMMNDSDTVILLSTEDTVKGYNLTYFMNDYSDSSELGQETIFIDRVTDLIEQEPSEQLGNLNSPTDLTYITYVSGSTDNPNGVAVEHRNLLNYLNWAVKTYVKGQKINFPLYTSVSLDLTVTSLYVPIISGNTLVIYDHQNPKQLIPTIFEEDVVQAIKLTPVDLQSILEIDIIQSKIKRLIISGEELKAELAREIMIKFNYNLEIYHEYGHAEVTVGCMLHMFKPDSDTGDSIPVGRPIDNVQIFILDKYQMPVLPGVPGEIYISGECIARGYINNPELTKEKFVKIALVPDRVLYRTGDKGRRLANGNIEILGRYK